MDFVIGRIIGLSNILTPINSYLNEQAVNIMFSLKS